MKQYILYSTILCVFSEVLQILEGINLKLFYLILITNLFLILVSNFKGLKYNLYHITALFYLLVTGIVSILLGTNKIDLFALEMVGIAVTSIYFYLFFKCYEDFGVQKIFLIYCKISYYVVLIGYVLYPLRMVFATEKVPRFYSIFQEPAHFVMIVFPAFFYYFRSGDKLKTIIMAVAFILSLSSVGYIGIIFGLLLNSKIKPGRIFLSLLVSFTIIFLLYQSIDLFKVRVDDTVGALTRFDVKDVNVSTYSFVSNLYVAIKSFISDPLFGRGLGSHYYSHQKYIGDLPGAKTLFFGQYIDLDSKDANSLFLRIMSDLGLAGLFLTFYFMFKNYAAEYPLQKTISKAICLYFFCKLFREGEYFSPEVFFFVMLYYFNSRALPEDQQEAAV